MGGNKPQGGTIVDELFQKHGYDVEKRASVEDDLTAFNWYNTEFEAGRFEYQFELTESEERALDYMYGRFEPEGYFRRTGDGLDFVYGNIGFEVKTDKHYELSENQLDHAELMEYVYVILVAEVGEAVFDVLDREAVAARRRQK